MSIKPDIANWPVGTEIVFEDGVRGILKPAEPEAVQRGADNRGGKSLWLTKDNRGQAWNTWSDGYWRNSGNKGYEIKEIILPKGSTMDRQKVIRYLKEGEWSPIAGKFIYISFGQLSPEVQAVAIEIGHGEFIRVLHGGNTPCSPAGIFDFNCTYRLRADYEDKKESEYEYLEIKKGNVHYCYVLDGVKHITSAPSLVGFVGYADKDKEFVAHKIGGSFNPETCKYVVIEKG